MKRILLIEICNYDDYPIGGYLSFAKQLVKAFGDQLALVGLVTDMETPIGEWTKKTIDGVTFDFFGVMRTKKESKKKIIPGRLESFIAVKRYKKQILNINIKNIFIQTPEVLFALNIGSEFNLCCRIPGLENPLSISRYSYSKFFANSFEKSFFKKLQKANLIFATGDNKALDNYIKRSEGVLNPKKIIKFPSRIDLNIFKPIDNSFVRISKGWDLSKFYIVTSGRLSELKGWKFMLDCFIDFRVSKPDSHFIFIGDGEDKEKILDYLKVKQISKHVTITGRINHKKLSELLNTADLYIMGSYIEGWSTSLVEAIACAKPVVCTDFSSAEELVEQGVNGFVVKNHDKDTFVRAMIKSLGLPKDELYKKAESMKIFSTDSLKSDILKYWKLK